MKWQERERRKEKEHDKERKHEKERRDDMVSCYRLIICVGVCYALHIR